MNTQKVSLYFYECPTKEGEFKYRDFEPPFLMTDFVLESAKSRGPKMVINFAREEADGKALFKPRTIVYGVSGYYVEHPEEIFWEIEPHIEIEGYSPLKIKSLDEFQVGDCELKGNELWSYRTLGNMFDDYILAPVSNLRKRSTYGSFKNSVMFANLNNKLYRKNTQ